MGDGKHCPDCGKDIGVWPVFSAPIPSRIRCPHCSTRLGYRETTGVILVAIALGIGLGACAFWLSWKYGGRSPRLWVALFAGSVIVPWALAELAITAYLRGRGRLERIDPDKEKATDQAG